MTVEKRRSGRLDLRRFLAEPLHRNSALIILSQGLGAVLGFIFLWLAYWFYPEDQVGVGMALISAATLVATLSLLGYDIGIIRFFPAAANKRVLINTYLTVAGALSLLAAAVFVGGLAFWSPELLVISSRWAYTLAFVGFTAFTTVGLLQAEAFIAMRRPGLQFVQTVFSAVRLPVLALALAAGAFGIFLAWGITSTLLLITGALLMVVAYPGYRPVPTVHEGTIRSTLRFSFGNYLAKSLDSLPARVMPILILGLVSAESSGYFYTAYSISGLMGIVIWSVSAALLAEGSHRPDDLRGFVVKAVRFSAFFLIPLVLLIVLAARPILSVFPEEFPEDAVRLLRLLAMSWLPASVNITFVTVARVRMQTRPLLVVYGAIAVLIIGGSLLAVRWLGLAGVGVVWLAVQTVVALVVTPLMLKMAGFKLTAFLKAGGGRA